MCDKLRRYISLRIISFSSALLYVWKVVVVDIFVFLHIRYALFVTECMNLSRTKRISLGQQVFFVRVNQLLF